MEKYKKYLDLCYLIIIHLRYEARNNKDEKSYKLLDSIHNIPYLVTYEKQINEEIILKDILEIEKKYFNWENKFSKNLKN